MMGRGIFNPKGFKGGIKGRVTANVNRTPSFILPHQGGGRERAYSVGELTASGDGCEVVS